MTISLDWFIPAERNTCSCSGNITLGLMQISAHTNSWHLFYMKQILRYYSQTRRGKHILIWAQISLTWVFGNIEKLTLTFLWGLFISFPTRPDRCFPQLCLIFFFFLLTFLYSVFSWSKPETHTSPLLRLCLYSDLWSATAPWCEWLVCYFPGSFVSINIFHGISFTCNNRVELDCNRCCVTRGPLTFPLPMLSSRTIKI